MQIIYINSYLKLFSKNTLISQNYLIKMFFLFSQALISTSTYRKVKYE